MKTEFIEAKAQVVIERPFKIVKSQFMDFEHHIEKQVHRGVHFEILAKYGERTHLKVVTRVAGLKQIDEWMVYAKNETTIIHEFVKGLNQGGGIEINLVPQGENATTVQARAFVPKKGIKKFLSPIFRKALQKIGETSLAEDKKDLENGYSPQRTG